MALKKLNQHIGRPMEKLHIPREQILILRDAAIKSFIEFNADTHANIASKAVITLVIHEDVKLPKMFEAKSGIAEKGHPGHRRYRLKASAVIDWMYKYGYCKYSSEMLTSYKQSFHGVWMSMQPKEFKFDFDKLDVDADEKLK